MWEYVGKSALGLATAVSLFFVVILLHEVFLELILRFFLLWLLAIAGSIGLVFGCLALTGMLFHLTFLKSAGNGVKMP